MSGNIHQCRTVIGSLNQKFITSLHNIVMNELTTSKRLEKSCLLMLKDLCNNFRTSTLDYKTYFNNKFKLGYNHNSKGNSCDFIPISFISKD